jgi:hypothetical protein
MGVMNMAKLIELQGATILGCKKSYRLYLEEDEAVEIMPSENCKDKFDEDSVAYLSLFQARTMGLYIDKKEHIADDALKALKIMNSLKDVLREIDGCI